MTKTTAPDRYERVLAYGALLMSAVIVAAVFKGRPQWDQIPVAVWYHLATLGIALVLTPVLLLRRRGDKSHRVFGWIWATAMFATALISFDLRLINHGGFSLIHLLSVLTIVVVPVLVWAAKTHRIERHRRNVRGLITGALLAAGFFTFPFDRLLGHWLFG